MNSTLKALVVDDSRAIRGILKKILVNNGFEVSEAADGCEALKTLKSETEDLSLLCVDYNMPNMNGLQLVKEMRAIDRFARVPILMITTETHMEALQMAFQAGVSEYIMKPFTSQMIVEKLRMVGALAE